MNNMDKVSQHIREKRLDLPGLQRAAEEAEQLAARLARALQIAEWAGHTKTPVENTVLRKIIEELQHEPGTDRRAEAPQASHGPERARGRRKPA